MTRPLRIRLPGGLYHVYSRGIGKMDLFRDDDDRLKFMTVLSDTLSSAGWKCFAYCLMGNHYHLLLETADGDTSAGMKRLNGLYAQYFNWRHDRVGPLFQGRYKAILIDRENYFLELCRYIVLNPVRSGQVKTPADYRWSSYRATAGMIRKDGPVDRKSVLAWFSGESESAGTAAESYIQFVSDGLRQNPVPFDVRGDLILGDREFLENLREQVEKDADEMNNPGYQRMACRPDLEDLLDPLTASMKHTRNEAIIKAYFQYGYRQTEIAKHLGIHNSTVFRIINSPD